MMALSQKSKRLPLGRIYFIVTLTKKQGDISKRRNSNTYYAIEKDYGEKFIDSCKSNLLKSIQSTVEELQHAYTTTTNGSKRTMSSVVRDQAMKWVTQEKHAQTAVAQEKVQN